MQKGSDLSLSLSLFRPFSPEGAVFDEVGLLAESVTVSDSDSVSVFLFASDFPTAQSTFISRSSSLPASARVTKGESTKI